MLINGRIIEEPLYKCSVVNLNSAIQLAPLKLLDINICDHLTKTYIVNTIFIVSALSIYSVQEMDY